MVIFRSAEGRPSYHPADALEDAVRFVEHLRNSEQVGDARIFRLEEVAIEFKTYYKVEIAAFDESRPVLERPVVERPVAEVAAAAKAEVKVVEAPPAAPAPVPPAPAANGGRFGLFGKG
ncbi:MAG: hypothetical protein ACRD0F_00085 [Acidimicrobiales bacterium]